jgi:hypothetical protein
MVLVMHSTELQYLELFDLPSTASMFILAVNSVSAKPVEGETGDHSSTMLTSVELNYFSTHDSLGHNERLSLAPPHLALPVSVLTVHLQLPE